jgi:putative salt-induced outer membrane protein
MNMKSKIAIAALLLLPLSGQYAMAEEVTAEEKSSLTISAELGMLFITGNTKSGDIKAGLNVKHEEGQWLNLLSFNALAKKLEEEDSVTGEDEFVSTENKWSLLGQSNYSFEEGGKNYLYGSVYYEQDKFKNFEYQTSASFGWGRHWWETETSSFFADIGPGVKYDVIGAQVDPTVAQYSETAAIVQAQALYTKQINEFVEFKQYLVAKQAFESDKNSVYKS